MPVSKKTTSTKKTAAAPRRRSVYVHTNSVEFTPKRQSVLAEVKAEVAARHTDDNKKYTAANILTAVVVSAETVLLICLIVMR